MSLGPEDRLAITELISRHGHLVDDGGLDQLEEVFTSDVAYDLTDFGQEAPLLRVAAIRERWERPILSLITSPTWW